MVPQTKRLSGINTPVVNVFFYPVTKTKNKTSRLFLSGSERRVDYAVRPAACLRDEPQG